MTQLNQTTTTRWHDPVIINNNSNKVTWEPPHPSRPLDMMEGEGISCTVLPCPTASSTKFVLGPGRPSQWSNISEDVSKSQADICKGQGLPHSSPPPHPTPPHPTHTPLPPYPWTLCPLHIPYFKGLSVGLDALGYLPALDRLLVFKGLSAQYPAGTQCPPLITHCTQAYNPDTGKATTFKVNGTNAFQI